MRGRVEFAHALVREAVEDELNVLRRARLHRRAADALTALGEDRHLEEIAAHLFEAASVADARQVSAMLVRAGRRARHRLAYGDAAERFDRAREALEFAEAGDEAGPVLLARGDAGARGCLYERLAPYAGRPATSGRAVSSYGAVDRRLGGLAAVLGGGRTPSGTCARRSRGTPSSAARSGARTGCAGCTRSRRTMPSGPRRAPRRGARAAAAPA